MTLPLRPATLGEILDRTANLYRSRFLVFAGIAAVPSVVVVLFYAGMALLSWSARYRTQDPAAMAGVGLGLFALMLLFLPAWLGVTALGTAAMTWAADQEYQGERATIRAAYIAAWKRGWHAVGLFTIQALILWAVSGTAMVFAVGGLAAFAVAMHGANADPSWGLMLLIGCAVVAYALWMLSRLCLAFPVFVTENAGVGAALKRGWRLSAGTRWRILVMYLLRAALGWAAWIAMAVPMLVLLSLLPRISSVQHQQTLTVIVMLIIYGCSFLGQMLAKPVSGIALVVFCYDQKIRQEAFDIEWMMRQAGMVDEPALPAQAWTAATSASTTETRKPASLQSPAPSAGESA